MSRLVLRTSGQRAIFLILPLFFAASTLMTYADASQYARPGLRVLLVPIFLLYGWVMSLGRARVVVGEDGLTVVNPLRRHRLGWSEVEGFGWGAWRVVHAPPPAEVSWTRSGQLRWDRWYGLGMMPKMCAVLRDGSVVAMFGLMVGGGGLSRSAKEKLSTMEWARQRAHNGKPL